MSTIRFNQSKETVVTAGITLGLIAMVIVNLVVLIPAIYAIFVQSAPVAQREPIDVDSVSRAIELIRGTEE